jgi:hypothetical protein
MNKNNGVTGANVGLSAALPLDPETELIHEKGGAAPNEVIETRP